MTDSSSWVFAHQRLHRSGSIGDTAFNGLGRLLWLVSGHKGEILMRAEGRTR